MESNLTVEEEIEKVMAEKKFLENSVSVGEGEDNLSFMPDNFRERRDLEQYFFTKENIDSFINVFNMTYPDPSEIEEKVCLVCAPSLAKALHDDWGINVTLCDIDKRFDELPGFNYFNLKEPYDFPDKTFDMIFFDPPFFSVTLEQQFRAISTLAKGDFSTKLLLSYPHRDEKVFI